MEVSGMPRVSEQDEMVLRLIGMSWRTAIELVELSDGKISAGTIYARLSRLHRESYVKKDGRWYEMTPLGVALLRALDAGGQVFRDSVAG